jgi:hypothetical protein
MGSSCDSCHPLAHPTEPDLVHLPNRLRHLHPPQFYNPLTRAFSKRLGPYLYTFTPMQLPEEHEGPIVGPNKRERGSRYYGEVRGEQGEIREGQGKQLWPDYTLYEGYWREDKPEGKGRMIHANG